MKLRYKKKRLKFYLIITIFWLIIGISCFVFCDSGKLTTYFQTGISVIYIFVFSVDYFNQYLTIQNGIIKENNLFGKKMNLTEIKQIKKFAGFYILKTDRKEFKINTQIIDPDSLAELNAELEKLNVEWN